MHTILSYNSNHINGRGQRVMLQWSCFSILFAHLHTGGVRCSRSGRACVRSSAVLANRRWKTWNRCIYTLYTHTYKNTQIKRYTHCTEYTDTHIHITDIHRHIHTNTGSIFEIPFDYILLKSS